MSYDDEELDGMLGIEYYPVVLNPVTVQKFKELSKEGVEGTSDAMLLYAAIIQWHTMNVEWTVSTVKEEIGFSEDYTNDLLNFMINEKILLVE